MSIGCMIGDMEHAAHLESVERPHDESQVTTAPSPIARRRSLVGALGSLTRAHARAVEWLDLRRRSPRPAYHTPSQHRAQLDAAAARVDGFLARLVAVRAELATLDVRDGRCHARCRDGHACRAPCVRGRRRCKLHGGLSTGPRTPEGKVRALAALAIVHARRRAPQQVTDGAQLDAVTREAA